MNILVTGANGQLGRHVRRCSADSVHTFHFTDVEELDITDLAAVQCFVSKNKIDAIINCAAYVNVDKAFISQQTMCLEEIEIIPHAQKRSPLIPLVPMGVQSCLENRLSSHQDVAI